MVSSYVATRTIARHPGPGGARRGLHPPVGGPYAVVARVPRTLRPARFTVRLRPP